MDAQAQTPDQPHPQTKPDHPDFGVPVKPVLRLLNESCAVDGALTTRERIVFAGIALHLLTGNGCPEMAGFSLDEKQAEMVRRNIRRKIEGRGLHMRFEARRNTGSNGYHQLIASSRPCKPAEEKDIEALRKRLQRLLAEVGSAEAEEVEDPDSQSSTLPLQSPEREHIRKILPVLTGETRKVVNPPVREKGKNYNLGRTKLSPKSRRTLTMLLETTKDLRIATPGFIRHYLGLPEDMRDAVVTRKHIHPLKNYLDRAGLIGITIKYQPSPANRTKGGFYLDLKEKPGDRKEEVDEDPGEFPPPIVKVSAKQTAFLVKVIEYDMDHHSRGDSIVNASILHSLKEAAVQGRSTSIQHCRKTAKTLYGRDVSAAQFNIAIDHMELHQTELSFKIRKDKKSGTIQALPLESPEEQSEFEETIDQYFRKPTEEERAKLEANVRSAITCIPVLPASREILKEQIEILLRASIDGKHLTIREVTKSERQGTKSRSLYDNLEKLIEMAEKCSLGFFVEFSSETGRYKFVPDGKKAKDSDTNPEAVRGRILQTLTRKQQKMIDPPVVFGKRRRFTAKKTAPIAKPAAEAAQNPASRPAQAAPRPETAPAPRPAPAPTSRPEPRTPAPAPRTPAPAPRTPAPAPKPKPAPRPAQTLTPTPESKALADFVLTDLIATLAIRYLSPDRRTTIQDLQKMSGEVESLLGRDDLDEQRRARLGKMPNAIRIVIAMARLRGSQEVPATSKLSLKGILLGEGQSVQEMALETERSAARAATTTTPTASPAKTSAKPAKAPKGVKIANPDEKVSPREEGPDSDPREIQRRGRRDFDDGRPVDLTHIFPQDDY